MDQFVTAYGNAWRRYGDFAGRTSVGGFWRFVAVNFAVAIVLGILISISSAFAILYFVYALAVIIPGLAIAIRRLHDGGRSGWYLLLGFLPLIGAIILIVFYVQASDGPNQWGPGPQD
jgi:uncharacterized membrane protein YhaH (DUF805 family)